MAEAAGSGSESPYFTIGHSTHTIEAFVGLLQPEEVRLVVDVRTVPRSRTNPQFNRDVLPASLADFQIGYEHIAELGGLRGKSVLEPSPNTFWTNQSFRNYADYALSDAFRRGLGRLGELAAKDRCAIMCAEAVWWRCHRRIIADYLIASGQTVWHIMAQGRLQRAVMTPAAKVTAEGSLVYPEG
jgi:uncharacterized protein (DUF488 family)